MQYHILADHVGKGISLQEMVTKLVSANAMVPLGKQNWERINLEAANGLEYAARYNDVRHQVNWTHFYIYIYIYIYIIIFLCLTYALPAEKKRSFLGISWLMDSLLFDGF